MGTRQFLLCNCFFLYTLPAIGLLLLVSTSQAIQLTNVALFKPTWISTKHSVSFGNPSKVVDGYKNTHVSNCATTMDADPTPDRWFRVDLQGLYQIHRVELTNRGDCCGERLANFDVLVHRDVYNASSGRQEFSRLCFHRQTAIATGATVTLDCTQPVVGRYVTLVKPASSDLLTLCEMEVLGAPASLVSQESQFQRYKGKKSSGNDLKTTWANGVISCTTACIEEPGCLAVNLQLTSLGQRGERICQLLASSGNVLQSDNDWNVYVKRSSDFEIVLV